MSSDNFVQVRVKHQTYKIHYVSEVKRLDSEAMKAETWGVEEDRSMAGFCYINDPLGVRIELVSRAGLPPGVGTDPAAT